MNLTVERGTLPEHEAVPAVARIGRRPRSEARRPYLVLNGAVMTAIAAIALSFIGMLYLIQTSQVAGLGYQLSHLQDRQDALSLENSRLGYEIARYQALDRVAQVATERLGMVELQRYEFLEVQRPVEEDLPPPPRATPAPESLRDWLWRGVTGTGRASAPAEGPPALPVAGEGEPAE